GLRGSAGQGGETHVGSGSEGPFHFVERHAGTRRTLCAATARVPVARHTGENLLVMEICRRKNQIEISELDPFLAELLRQIPASANPEGAPAAEERIFSPPTNGTEPEPRAEGKLYVEPELRRIFQTATQTVAGDLEQLNGNEKSLANRTLRIPAKHADAWLS